MAAADTSASGATFGYLTILDHVQHGIFGGYLIVCAAGRPLEFHCTAPVRPTRAQEILYGPTLRPYLLADQIGATLLAKAKQSPRIVLTDQPDLVCLHSQLKIAVALLSDSSEPTVLSTRDAVIDGADQTPRHNSGSTVGGYSVELHLAVEQDRQTTFELLEVLSQRVDLSEPFERIQLAIREAQRISDGEQDSDARAA